MHTWSAGTASSAASALRFFFFLSTSLPLVAFAGLSMSSGAATSVVFAFFGFLIFVALSAMLCHALMTGNVLLVVRRAKRMAFEYKPCHAPQRSGHLAGDRCRLVAAQQSERMLPAPTFGPRAHLRVCPLRKAASNPSGCAQAPAHGRSGQKRAPCQPPRAVSAPALAEPVLDEAPELAIAPRGDEEFCGADGAPDASLPLFLIA